VADALRNTDFVARLSDNLLSSDSHFESPPDDDNQFVDLRDKIYPFTTRWICKKMARIAPSAPIICNILLLDRF